MFSPSVVSRAVRRVIVFLSFVLFNVPAFAQSFLERGSIFVSHFSADYASSNDEFVVLYNTVPDTSFLDGYELRYFTSTGSSGSILRSFPVGSAIPPFGHLLVASKETVAVGGAVAIRDQPLSPGMAATGGQIVLRNASEFDSVVFALAWGTVTTFVVGMTDAANWEGDGMISLSFVDGAYVRSSFNSSNSQYTHTSSSAITSIPSLHTFVPLVGSQWRLRIVAQQGDSRDSSVVVGMVDEATPSFDVSLDVPKPPPPAGGGVSVSSWRPEYLLATGPNLMVDYISVEPLAENAFSWRLSVTPTEFGSALFISCKPESLSTAIPVVLIDEEDGVRFSFSPQDSVYSFVPVDLSPRFLRLSVGDTTAPSVTIERPTENERLVAGRVEQLRWEVTDASGIDTIGLSVQTAPSSDFVPLSSPSMADTGYVWQVPTTFLSESVRVRVFARDSMGNETIASSPFFSVVHDTVEHFFTAGWHLMGLPLRPMNNEVSAFVPPSGADSSYLFAFNPASGYVKADSLTHGRGYFLGLLSGRTLRIAGTNPEDTTASPLHQGFNIISLDASVPRVKEDLVLRKNGVRYTYAEALSASIIASGLTTYDWESGTYGSSDSLMPWKGYWLPVLEQDVTLTWEHQPSTPLRRHRRTAAGWRIRFAVSVGTITDSLAYLGTDDEASNAFDACFDSPAPPSPPAGRRVFARFEHPTWPSVLGSEYVGDVRNSDGALEWTLLVSTTTKGDAALSWRIEGEMPAEVTLMDDEENIRVDMTKKNVLTFPSGGMRAFRVAAAVTGISVNDEPTPRAFRLAQNYPNPFNAATQLAFEIPARMKVRLRVNDLLGREVAVLTDKSYDPGTYTVSWNAVCPSGVYFAILESGERSMVVRVVVVR